MSATDAAEKKGEWNLHVRKARASRWDYSLRNPQGGSFGSTSYKSATAAVQAAIGRGLKNGPSKVWVIQSVWDAGAEDFKVTKTYWQDVPKTESVRDLASALREAKMSLADRVMEKLSDSDYDTDALADVLGIRGTELMKELRALKKEGKVKQHGGTWTAE